MATDEDRDRDWLNQVAAGGPDAETALYWLHRTHRVRLMNSLRGKGVPDEDCEQVLNDLLTDLVRDPKRCPEEGSPLAWLHGALNYRAMRYFTRRKRERARATSIENQGAADPVDQASIEEEANRRQLVAAVRTALDPRHIDNPQLSRDVELLRQAMAGEWTMEQVAFFRFRRCMTKCKREPVCAQIDCRKGSLSGAGKALHRAREAVAPLLRGLWANRRRGDAEEG